MTVKPDIHINLFHPDLDQLQTLSERLALQLERMEGVHEVANSARARRTIVDINLLEEGRLAGLSSEQLGGQVRNAFHGIELDRWFERDQEVPVMLRLASADSRRLDDLALLPVRLPDGDITLLGRWRRFRGDCRRRPSTITTPAVTPRSSAYVDEQSPPQRG